MFRKLCSVLVLLFAVQFSISFNNDEGDFKVVCFLMLHTWYEPGYRDYSPEIIDETQCTHVIIRERIGGRNSTVEPILNDGKDYFHQRAGELIAKGKHVPLSIFKYNLYQHVYRLPSADERAAFVDSLVAFNEQYNFTGFDFRWYPNCRGCENVDEKKVNEDSIDLVRRFSEAFKPRGWILSVNLFANKTEFDTKIDVPKLVEYVDWVIVYAIESKERTSFPIPLYGSPDNPNDEANLNWTINYLMEKGIPSRKILLPTSSTGLSYELTSTENGLNAPAGRARSSQDGFYDLCRYIKNDENHSWTVVHGTEKRVGTYAFAENKWKSFEDLVDVQRKADYIRQNNLGGGIITINSDDFQNVCGCGKYPLLTALAQALRNATAPRLNDCL